jgi:epoxyqueuosine reductase
MEEINMAWYAGYPREKIQWYPTIDHEKCVECGKCMNCGAKVYKWTEEGPVVDQPYKCTVGCTTCATLCQGNAITFPDKKTIRELYQKERIWSKVQKELKEDGLLEVKGVLSANKTGSEIGPTNKESLKNEGCGCGSETTSENVDEPPKDEPNDEGGCCGGTVDEQTEEKSEESEGCGCGCGGEHPDESEVENPHKPEFMADDAFMEEFEKYAHSLGIKSIGYTQLTPELLIQDKFVQYPNAIVLTMEMSDELIETAPGDKTQEINDAHYAKLGTLSYKLSDYLREKGYATEVAHPYGGLVNFCTLAQKAGMGFIGKSGLLITPESGPRQKISSIFVSIANLPVKEDNKHAWIPDYCEKCGKCIKACPEKALIETETCCGGKEVEFDQKLCIGCSQGCTYCIEDCPFYEKGYEHVKNKFDKLNAKLKEKQNKKFQPELWDNWAKQNSSLFAGLVDGATMAISMTQNNEKIVLLEKEGNDVNVSVKQLKEELESPLMDLMFDIDEKDMGKLLNDASSIKFIDLVSSGKIGVYAFRTQIQLMDKGYMGFLNRLGLRIGAGGCCG